PAPRAGGRAVGGARARARLLLRRRPRSGPVAPRLPRPPRRPAGAVQPAGVEAADRPDRPRLRVARRDGGGSDRGAPAPVAGYPAPPRRLATRLLPGRDRRRRRDRLDLRTLPPRGGAGPTPRVPDRPPGVRPRADRSRPRAAPRTRCPARRDRAAQRRAA